MKTIRLILVSISGFIRSASAMFVIGPSASMVTSPGRRSISAIRNSTAAAWCALRPVSRAPAAGFTSSGVSANAPV